MVTDERVAAHRRVDGERAGRPARADDAPRRARRGVEHLLRGAVEGDTNRLSRRRDAGRMPGI